MAAPHHIQHVSEFSPDGKLFAFINSEGKLQIWDTEANVLKQDYIPNLHLSAPCTCFTWVTVTTDAASTSEQGKSKNKKARKSIDQSATSLFIALGTSKGGVSLYSYATGKIEKYLKGDGHAGPITSICRGSSDTLYTCGEDCRIVSWSISAGAQLLNSSWKIGTDKPTCITYLSESNQLLVGSRELKLWSVDGKQELKQSFTGHTSNVIILKYLLIDGDEYVLSTSKMDRTISMWRIKASDKFKNAAATFLMADVAYYVNTSVVGSRLEVSAVTRSGVAHVFIVKDVDEISSAKPVKPKVTIEIASDQSDTVEPIPVVTASISLGVNQESMLIGYGDRQFLHFENIEYSTAEKNQVLIRKDPKKVVTGSKQSAVAKDKLLKTITPIVDDTAAYQTATTVRKNIRSIEMPMETRLENLTLEQSETNTKNVAQLLIQGLHNKDSNILRTVLDNDDEKVIRSTLQRLPPQYVANLINQLTLMTQQKTSNIQKATVWMRLIVHTHASHLMALGSNQLFVQFGPLLGIIEQRTNSIHQLSKLSGRLDLLLSQIKRNTDDDHEDMLNNQHLLVFEDADSLNGSDLESHASSSDEQWEEESEAEEPMDVSDEGDDDD